MDGREDHAPRLDAQQLTQVGAALGLDGRLPQKLAAARECAEELVVQVVAVGEHDEGWVLHRRFADDAPRIEGHGEALPRALRVPDHANAPVARLTARPPAGLVATRDLGDPVGLAPQLGGPQRLRHRHLHRMELVVARHLLDQRPAARVLEDDEVPDEVEEAAAFQISPRSSPATRAVRRRRQRLARDGAPGLEPFPPGGKRADPRLDAVGDDQQALKAKSDGNSAL